ncbi:MAG: primosomal protein N' [Muribaculaceae bacterium]|nr:primosomal protein N' [Muribaculaceae bacterium]
MYAEIILPLPIYATYTYSVPKDMESRIRIGMRVMVQFGKKKFYTGIVENLHNNPPGYEVKDIISLPDAEPLLRYPQLKLWNWIAEYYLCSIGEVMKAALPAGLKPESETFVTLNSDFGTPEGVKLSEKEAAIVMLLEQKKNRMRISEIESELNIRNATQTIDNLLNRDIVRIDEKVVERYRPKLETHVEITLKRGDHEGLKNLFELTKKSRNQEKALVSWLELSGWLHPAAPLRNVSRSDLLESSDISAAVLRAMVDKGIFRIEKRILNRFNNTGTPTEPIPPLSTIQSQACSQIKDLFHDTQTVLLHGVTGSGKTEIYSHLIQNALADGNQVLYLVPEISLTTQLTDRLRKFFGDKLLVYHSKFSDSERIDIWKRMLSSHQPLIVLGARSALFLPFDHLGLVVVDEEHESSYKQYDPAPRYNARDTAVMLASMHGAKVLLGSATPSIETYYKALEGKFGLVTLSERFSGAQLPEVDIIDMREQRKKKINRGIMSSPLVQRLTSTLKSNKQAILFQNRRGFAPVVICRECGWTPKCVNCDVSLVYHKQSDMLKCHYCGYTMPLPAVCPACGQNSIDKYGYGTERISEEVAQVLPEARVSRMDLDTTRNKDSYQKIIEEFANHDTDILVGTQMVTKGLDFNDVDTAAVINADTLLNFPDFRSNERAYNMLEQVSGRAGRRKDNGLVLIQTTDPENPVLEYVKNHNYTGFYKSEIEEREKYNYPPFTKIINIYLRHKDAVMCLSLIQI